MADLYTIRMNYRKGREQASKLEDLSQKLRKEGEVNLEETIGDVARNWTGENAEAYIAKLRLLQDRIGKTADKLQRAAQVVGQIVQNTYDAEMESYRIAQRRTYQ